MVFQNTLVDHADLVTGTGNILYNVGRENHDPVSGQFYEQVSETDSFPRVQTGCRLVHHEYSGQVQQGLCDTDTLFHTTRKTSDLLVLVLVHMHGGKYFGNPVVTYLFIIYSFQQGLVLQKFPCREVLVCSEFLR